MSRTLKRSHLNNLLDTLTNGCRPQPAMSNQKPGGWRRRKRLHRAKEIAFKREVVMAHSNSNRSGTEPRQRLSLPRQSINPSPICVLVRCLRIICYDRRRYLTFGQMPFTSCEFQPMTNIAMSSGARGYSGWRIGRITAQIHPVRVSKVVPMFLIHCPIAAYDKNGIFERSATAEYGPRYFPTLETELA